MPNVAKATTLKIDQIDEFSLVPRSMGKPANKHAQISITKAQEGGALMPPNEGIPADVQKALDAAEARIAKAEAAAAAKDAELAKTNDVIAKMQENEAFAKCEARIVSQGISKALAPDFRAFEKSNPEASGRIESELAKALARADATEALTKQISRAAPPQEGSNAAKLAKAVQEVQSANPGLTHAQAVTKAITANPELAGE